jgi:hypothetical protein
MFMNLALKTLAGKLKIRSALLISALGQNFAPLGWKIRPKSPQKWRGKEARASKKTAPEFRPSKSALHASKSPT